VVSRSEVETADISLALRLLRRLLESPGTSRKFYERVEIVFDGYDHIQDELFEISEGRNFVYRLDEKFPFWLFFL
jgi:hypothetical protein